MSLPDVYRGRRACPRCQGEIVVVASRQDPLFIHGGYGEARVETVEVCFGCRRSSLVRVESVRPWAA